MKIAVAGKGGSGKSTVAAALALLQARAGGRVLAVDADPDANLASTLGLPVDNRREIVPISEQRALIEERTGAKVRQYGQLFKLNPEVADIADRFAVNHNGVDLLVLGAIEAGGSGCACPESVLIKALVADLVLHKNEALVMDMEAGVEHLGRGTARGVDTMLVVVEPSRMSVECADRVFAMAAEWWPTRSRRRRMKPGSARRWPAVKLLQRSPTRRRSAPPTAAAVPSSTPLTTKRSPDSSCC